MHIQLTDGIADLMREPLQPPRQQVALFHRRHLRPILAEGLGLNIFRHTMQTMIAVFKKLQQQIVFRPWLNQRPLQECSGIVSWGGIKV
jgi:hypothetical protein